MIPLRPSGLTLLENEPTMTAPDPALRSVVRTPDERSASLPGYAFEPHRTDALPGFEGVRVHCLDDGPADANETALCLHGQPSWSYLCRKMFPVFVAAGQRLIAPDMLGFGKSDKPEGETVYSSTRHRDMLLALIDALKLDYVTLVVQEWGGVLGLTLPMDLPGVVKRLIVINTAVGTGDLPLGKGFTDWRTPLSRPGTGQPGRGRRRTVAASAHMVEQRVGRSVFHGCRHARPGARPVGHGDRRRWTLRARAWLADRTCSAGRFRRSLTAVLRQSGIRRAAARLSARTPWVAAPSLP